MAMRESKRFALHLAAAVVILVLLGLHMTIMHLDGLLTRIAGFTGDPLAWEQVLARGRSLFFALTYVVLLGAALYHGLYGLHTMIAELEPPPRVQRTITAVLWIGGVVLFGVGTAVTLITAATAAAGGMP